MFHVTWRGKKITSKNCSLWLYVEQRNTFENFPFRTAFSETAFRKTSLSYQEFINVRVMNRQYFKIVKHQIGSGIGHLHINRKEFRSTLLGKSDFSTFFIYLSLN